MITLLSKPCAHAACCARCACIMQVVWSLSEELAHALAELHDSRSSSGLHNSAATGASASMPATAALDAQAAAAPVPSQAATPQGALTLPQHSLTNCGHRKSLRASRFGPAPSGAGQRQAGEGVVAALIEQRVDSWGLFGLNRTRISVSAERPRAERLPQPAAPGLWHPSRAVGAAARADPVPPAVAELARMKPGEEFTTVSAHFVPRRPHSNGPLGAPASLVDATPTGAVAALAASGASRALAERNETSVWLGLPGSRFEPQAGLVRSRLRLGFPGPYSGSGEAAVEEVQEAEYFFVLTGRCRGRCCLPVLEQLKLHAWHVMMHVARFLRGTWCLGGLSGVDGQCSGSGRRQAQASQLARGLKMDSEAGVASAPCCCFGSSLHCSAPPPSTGVIPRCTLCETAAQAW